MSEFHWKRGYKLGIEAIDSQHKTIIEKFNVLLKAISTGERPDRITFLMADLIAYAQVHFHDEEALFAQAHYPGADEQQAAHRQFKIKAEAIYAAYQENPTIDPLVIVEYLQNWIENHMLTLDMNYKEFMVKLEALRKIQ